MAVVVRVAFTAMVTAFVADLITPLIAAIFGKPDVGGLSFKVHGSTFKRRCAFCTSEVAAAA